ncbi:hypothetical protein CBS101457_006498 [Exobasidium rhododendri]|nr:hypothetical protein CBS101457_006498 [Exobasidium rhododendri]
MSTKAEDQMQTEAQKALNGDNDVNCEGFQSSKVFALTKQMIENAPPGSTINRKRLIRRTKAIFLFVVHPSQPLDPSNPRTKPSKAQSGGGIRPAYWYVDLKKTGTVGRGHPPKTLLGRKTKADVVIECMDRDLVDIATGRTFATRVYNSGRMKIKGSLDTALAVAELLSHERSQLYGTTSISAASSATYAETNSGADHSQRLDEDYKDGSPAPVPTDITRSRL